MKFWKKFLVLVVMLSLQTIMAFMAALAIAENLSLQSWDLLALIFLFAIAGGVGTCSSVWVIKQREEIEELQSRLAIGKNHPHEEETINSARAKMGHPPLPDATVADIR